LAYHLAVFTKSVDKSYVSVLGGIGLLCHSGSCSCQTIDKKGYLFL